MERRYSANIETTANAHAVINHKFIIKIEYFELSRFRRQYCHGPLVEGVSQKMTAWFE